MGNSVFGNFKIDPRYNPAVLDTANWDREASWKIITSIDNSYWESVKKAVTDSKPLPIIEKLTLFRESLSRDGNTHILLSKLHDSQEVFIGIGEGNGISVLGEPVGRKRINDNFFISAYPTDASIIDNFCRKINPQRGPKALGVIPRLGIGVRMSTSVWPAIWSAMDKKSFSSNAIQNSIRELNLLEDLRAGKSQKKNYLFSFGEIEEGHTGSTFEGLWVYGVLDSLKYNVKQDFGADADHIQVKKGIKGIDRAIQVINAARYYSFYTLDVSDILNYNALPMQGSGEKYFNIIKNVAEQESIITFHREKSKIVSSDIFMDRELIGRLVGKYWEALDALEELYHYIIKLKNGVAFDLEMSIDENPPGIKTCECLTTEYELVFIINEVQRRGINLTHIAPNFGVEKGVDYRCPGGLERLKMRVMKLHQIASDSNVMLDCHSGDDLSSVTRKVFGNATRGNIHFKISPALQNLFAETLYDYDPALFSFWWDATMEYVKQKAEKGSEFAAEMIKKFKSMENPVPSPHQDLFHYYSFAPVGLRDSANRYMYRERFYSLPVNFYDCYRERVEQYLSEVAIDIFRNDTWSKGK